MICPKCGHKIADRIMARIMGKKGGLISGAKPRSGAQILALAKWNEWQTSQSKVGKLVTEIEEEERQEEK